MATALNGSFARIRGLAHRVSFLSSPTTSMFLLSGLVGLGAGLAAVIFRAMIDIFHGFFFHTFHGWLSFMGQYYILIIPAIGAVIFGPIIYFLAPESKGHGVPQVIMAMERRGGRIRPIVALVTSLASSLCIGSGGSAGREGPVVQVGAALGSSVGQIFHLNDERMKILVACGAAGGLAAVFNAPLGGLFFALEVILRDFSARRVSNVVVAAVTGSVVASIILGNEPFVHIPSYFIKSPVELVFYLILGCVAAPFAVLFTRMLYLFEDFFDDLKINYLFKPVIGALLLGGLGLFFPQVLGVGYDTLVTVLHGHMLFKLLVLLIPLKMLAVCLTLGSGGSGGVFSPSFVIGAFVGGAFGVIVSVLFPGLGIEPGAYALVGMGVFFAGFAHAPMTAFLIIFELTGDYLIILPLMLSVIISTAISERIFRESIFTLSLVREGVDVKKERVRDIMESIRVGEILGKARVTVLPSAPIDEIIRLVEKENRASVVVVDEEGNYHGIITLDLIIPLLRNRENLLNVIVAEDIAKNVSCIEESSTLKEAMRMLVETGMDVLPVVKKVEEETRLTGTVSKDDILGAYRREVAVRRG